MITTLVNMMNYIVPALNKEDPSGALLERLLPSQLREDIRFLSSLNAPLSVVQKTFEGNGQTYLTAPINLPLVEDVRAFLSSGQFDIVNYEDISVACVVEVDDFPVRTKAWLEEARFFWEHYYPKGKWFSVLQAIPMYFDRRFFDLSYLDDPVMKDKVKAAVRSDVTRLLEASGYGESPGAGAPQPPRGAAASPLANAAKAARPFVASIRRSRPPSIGSVTTEDCTGGAEATQEQSRMENCSERADELMRLWESKGAISAGATSLSFNTLQDLSQVIIHFFSFVVGAPTPLDVQGPLIHPFDRIRLPRKMLPSCRSWSSAPPTSAATPVLPGPSASSSRRPSSRRRCATDSARRCSL